MNPLSKSERHTEDAPDFGTTSPDAMREGAAGVELNIEELVFHGFARLDRHSVADAVEGELRRLLVERHWPAKRTLNVDVERLDAGGFGVPPEARPNQLGQRLAQAIFDAVRGPLDGK